MAHKIMWEDCEPMPEHEALIRCEVDGLLENGLTRVADLIFHTITLTDDFEGPTIIVNGKEGDETDTIYATFYENPEIVTVGDSRPPAR